MNEFRIEGFVMDCDFREYPSGFAVSRLSIGVPHNIKENGEWVVEARPIRVEWKKGKQITTGTPVMVSGRIVCDRYEWPKGSGQRKESQKLIAERVDELSTETVELGAKEIAESLGVEADIPFHHIPHGKVLARREAHEECWLRTHVRGSGGLCA